MIQYLKRKKNKMMRNIFILVCILLFMQSAFADTMPFYLDSIPKGTIGMYQTGDSITIFSEPEANSKIIKNLTF